MAYEYSFFIKTFRYFLKVQGQLLQFNKTSDLLTHAVLNLTHFEVF